MRERALLLSFVALSLAFAPAPFPKPGKRPPGLPIGGVWVYQRDSAVTLVVTPTMLTYRRHDFKDAYEFAFNPAAEPKTYTLRKNGSLDSVGIYRIDGDVLTLCYRNATMPRPASFEEKGACREIFTRVK